MGLFFFQVSVLEFYSPGRFFLLVQSSEVMEALRSITTGLQKACCDPLVTLYVPSVGEVCAVQFSCDMVSRISPKQSKETQEHSLSSLFTSLSHCFFMVVQNWYRGLVQTLAADQKVASILYIDFGNEESVPVDRIRPLPANIQPFPPCVSTCSFETVVNYLFKLLIAN